MCNMELHGVERRTEGDAAPCSDTWEGDRHVSPDNVPERGAEGARLALSKLFDQPSVRVLGPSLTSLSPTINEMLSGDLIP